MSTTGSNFYADFQGMTSLRARAKQDPQAVLREVAGQFESLFLEQVLKSMRSANLGEGLFDNQHSEMYREMYDKQMAKDLSTSGNGIGLADMLVRQLGGQTAPPRSVDHSMAVSRRVADGAETAPEPAVADVARADEWRPESPDEFIRDLWPQAQGAAAELGVAPEVLVAQAALETGWGRSVSRGADGASSHNLFNIKADHRWDGDHVTISTLEYRDGVAVRERADFRAYDSFEESFRDYVDFLRANPRYGDVLANANDPQAYIQGLQDAGYATDPSYAKKIGSILARYDMSEMRQTVAALQEGESAPIT